MLGVSLVALCRRGVAEEWTEPFSPGGRGGGGGGGGVGKRDPIAASQWSSAWDDGDDDGEWTDESEEDVEAARETDTLVARGDKRWNDDDDDRDRSFSGSGDEALRR